MNKITIFFIVMSFIGCGKSVKPYKEEKIGQIAKYWYRSNLGIDSVEVFNGKIKTNIFHYRNGQPDGLQIDLSPSGIASGKRICNSADGTVIDSEFYETGMLHLVSMLKQGQFVNTTFEFYADGNLHFIKKYIIVNGTSVLNSLYIMTPQRDTVQDSSAYFVLYTTRPPYTINNEYAFKVVVNRNSNNKKILMQLYDFDLYPPDSCSSSGYLSNYSSDLLSPKEVTKGRNINKGVITIAKSENEYFQMFFRDTFYVE